MRKIIQVQPSFFLNTTCDQKIIKQYRDKYNAISQQLDDNPQILKMVHKDLRRCGTGKGRDPNISSEQVLRMIIVRFIEQLTYRKVIIRVAESDFLRNFTRIGMSKVMSFGFLCDAFKIVNPSTWKKINELLRSIAYKSEKISDTRLRLDSTVSECNIHYPTDSSLLWDTYRVLARTIRYCNTAEPAWDLGNRFHDKKIKKLHTYISTHCAKKNKSTKRKVGRLMKKLIERVSCLCDTSRRYIQHARNTPTFSIAADGFLAQLEHFTGLGEHVVLQAYRSQVCKEKVPASERIFSIFEEHTELLKRGKSRKPIEFGHMVTIGQTAEKFISFYDVRQRSEHDIQLKNIALEAHKKSFSKYPREFTADKNYYESMSDIESWEEKVSCVAIGKKGPRNEEQLQREHDDLFQDLQRFRAGIEGTISVLKRAFGLRRCAFKSFKGFSLSVGCLVFCHNLVLLSKL